MDATKPHEDCKPLVPALRFDWTDWLSYLDESDASEEQKRLLIEALWAIIVAFVDLGWQLNSAPEISGSTFDLKAILMADEADEEAE